MRTEGSPRVFRRSFSRWPFLIAVALLAASVGDQLVEAVANTGIFGRAFFDTDNASIAPSIVAAALLAGGVIAGHMLAALGRTSRRRRDWFAVVARDVAEHSPLRDAGAVLGVQLAALFVMESAEQLLAQGHLSGGLLWLGGPPVFAIAAHVGVGLAVMLGASRLMRASLEPLGSLVCSALERVLCDRAVSGGAACVMRRDAASCNHIAAVLVRRVSGRAPPPLPLPT